MQIFLLGNTIWWWQCTSEYWVFGSKLQQPPTSSSPAATAVFLSILALGHWCLTNKGTSTSNGSHSGTMHYAEAAELKRGEGRTEPERAYPFLMPFFVPRPFCSSQTGMYIFFFVDTHCKAGRISQCCLKSLSFSCLTHIYRGFFGVCVSIYIYMFVTVESKKNKTK